MKEIKGQVYSVIRESGDKRPAEELVAEQCDGAVPTDGDLIIVNEIIDARLNRVEGHA